MKAKVFGSFIKDYEEKAAGFFAENPDLDVKHVAISLNQAGNWLLTAVFYEPKEETGQ